MSISLLPEEVTKFAEASRKDGNYLQGVIQSLEEIDSRKAKATVEKDLNMIMGIIEGLDGGHAAFSAFIAFSRAISACRSHDYQLPASLGFGFRGGCQSRPYKRWFQDVSRRFRVGG